MLPIGSLAIMIYSELYAEFGWSIMGWDKHMRIIISLMLLLSMGLCSCSNSLPAQISTGAPSDTEAMTKNENSGSQTGIEPTTIEYMGESIKAPGYYPNVPDAYIPVLDDLYLYREVSRRYSALNYKGDATRENMNECESAQKEIRARGYLPYPGDGLGATGGYALADLDGDGSPELLIMNYPSHMQTRSIKSVFAIRNGQLVCIENGSSDLYRAILTPGHVFYQCTDYGAGYADLLVFRLEAGMTEFTVFLEAHASLSFSAGDVPVPYWTKTEDGTETYIAEDEFIALLEQYRNLNEATLNFVPLNPDEANLLSTPHPTSEPSTAPIEYPPAYEGAPEAYKSILDALFFLEDHMSQEEYGEGQELDVVEFVEYPYPRDSKLGYALLDINNDGVLELLLGTIDGLNNSAPNSIFTLKDDQPVHLQSFWSRSNGVISADGIIYNAGSGGAAYALLSSYELGKKSDALTELTDIRSDYSDSEGIPYYYQVIEGKNHYISEQEFDNFHRIYNDPPERMKLTVFPIASY